MNGVIINVDSVNRRTALYFASLLNDALVEKDRDVTQMLVCEENALSDDNRDLYGILNPEVIIDIIKSTKNVYDANHDFKIVPQSINSLFLFDNVAAYKGTLENFLISVADKNITLNIILAPDASRVTRVKGVTKPMVLKRIVSIRKFYQEKCRLEHTHRYTLVLSESIMVSSCRDAWIEAIRSFVINLKHYAYKYKNNDSKVSSCMTTVINNKFKNKGLTGFINLSTNWKIIRRLGGISNDNQFKLESMYADFARQANL